jgi:dihydrofolate reductase
VLGSARLTASLMQMQLLDELRIIVNPVVLGKGRSFYEAGTQRSELKLLGNRTFKNGNVLLTYQPLPS